MQLLRNFKSQGTLGLGGTSGVISPTPAPSDEETSWLEDSECATRGPESWHSASPAAASPVLLCKERLPGRGTATELLRSQGSGMESAEAYPQSLRR